MEWKAIDIVITYVNSLKYTAVSSSADPAIVTVKGIVKVP